MGAFIIYHSRKSVAPVQIINTNAPLHSIRRRRSSCWHFHGCHLHVFVPCDGDNRCSDNLARMKLAPLQYGNTSYVMYYICTNHTYSMSSGSTITTYDRLYHYIRWSMYASACVCICVFCCVTVCASQWKRRKRQQKTQIYLNCHQLYICICMCCVYYCVKSKIEKKKKKSYRSENSTFFVLCVSHHCSIIVIHSQMIQIRRTIEIQSEKIIQAKREQKIVCAKIVWVNLLLFFSPSTSVLLYRIFF